MKTYKDKVSGETLYVKKGSVFTEYYKDKSMTIYHRRDGPSIECLDGYKEWYVNDKLHRLNGPAVEDVNERKVWLVNGVIITFITSNGKYEGPTLLQDNLNRIK